MKKSLILAIFVAAAAVPSLYGQVSTYVTLEDPTLQERESAMGILMPHQVSGRFGTDTEGGYLSPSPFQNRFADPGMKFTQDGSFIGINGSQSPSMFGSTTGGALPSESNMDLIEARQERRYQEQFQAALQERMAQEERRYQEAQSRANSEYLARQNAVATAPVSNRSQTSPEAQIPTNHPLDNPLGSPELLWMRGPATRSPRQNNPQIQGNISTGGEGYSNTNVNANNVDYGSQFIGGKLPSDESLNTEITPSGNAAPFPQLNRPGPTIAETEEQLQLLLLKSPSVNPLSPIQVRFNQGTVTIRGIVPSDAHKVEAGKILLSDSRVNSVDNQLTVLPSDPNAPLPQVFDPSLP